jgi:hypothetical protein
MSPVSASTKHEVRRIQVEVGRDWSLMWYVRCTCGWESKLQETPEAATAVARSHYAEQRAQEAHRAD